MSEEWDPLWAAAGTIGFLAIISFDATCPEEAWPLKTPDGSDLEWIRLIHGKLAVRPLRDPSCSDSMFSKAADNYAQI
jgi:hypothetical protein